MNEPALSNQSKHFPFSPKTHYRVIKEWYRNGTSFEVGQELIYDDFIDNHYDDVRIFCFKDAKQGYELRWPCSSHELDNWREYFEKIKTNDS